MASKYLKFVKSLPCCHCKSPADDAHHIIAVGMGAMGRKANNIHSMPLCRGCHTELHKSPGDWPQTRWMCETQLKAIEEGLL